MLTLSRREGETIHIGEDVVVHVTRIEGGKVRLSIAAPRSVPIMRGELLPRDAVTPPADGKPAYYSTPPRE